MPPAGIFILLSGALLDRVRYATARAVPPCRHATPYRRNQGAAAQPSGCRRSTVRSARRRRLPALRVAGLGTVAASRRPERAVAISTPGALACAVGVGRAGWRRFDGQLLVDDVRSQPAVGRVDRHHRVQPCRFHLAAPARNGAAPNSNVDLCRRRPADGHTYAFATVCRWSLYALRHGTARLRVGHWLLRNVCIRLESQQFVGVDARHQQRRRRESVGAPFHVYQWADVPVHAAARVERVFCWLKPACRARARVTPRLNRPSATAALNKGRYESLFRNAGRYESLIESGMFLVHQTGYHSDPV